MRRFALTLGLAWLVVGGRAWAGVEPFAPDEKAAGSMTLSGRTWSLYGPGYGMRIQRLDDDERARYLEHVTGERIDPFLARKDGPPGFESFLVEVTNRGDQELSFNPHDCWLVATKDDIYYPIGLEDLGMLYRQLEGELPEAYNVVRPALLDERETIAPGDSLAGLLIYHGLEPKTRRLQVDLQITLSTGDVVRASAPYRRLK